MRIELTPDGGATIWSERYGQHFHNRNGALTQARHVFLQGTYTDLHPAPQILEIGFGVGTNFLTTLGDATARSAPLRYLAFEFDPQPASTLCSLGDRHSGGTHPLWQEVMERWRHVVTESEPEFELEVSREPLKAHLGDSSVEIRFVDAAKADFPPAWATAVYLDGFSPAANPELWTTNFIAKLAAALQPGGWLATYSAAGAVRRALAAAGLRVQKRPGIAGKRECLHAQRLA